MKFLSSAGAFLAALLSLGVASGMAQEAPADDKGTRPGQAEEQPDLAAGNPDEGGATSRVDPARFGKVHDEAFGAYQRGFYLTALELARPRAEAGDAAAQTLVAEIYARGLGVRLDLEEAGKWYARAAEQGDPEAQMQYALLIIDGRVAEKNLDKAHTLMREAAEAGKPLAQFNMAQILLERGNADEEVVAWYERAAEAGLADAQYAMAQVHANGVGGKKADEAEARRWLQLAARQNFDTAQLDLGTWLVEGRGGERDYERGFAWLKRAADSGNVAARNRVAKLYRSGVGVGADPILAASWYIAARREGLTDPELEDFMQGLTEEQVGQAMERANDMR